MAGGANKCLGCAYQCKAVKAQVELGRIQNLMEITQKDYESMQAQRNDYGDQIVALKKEIARMKKDAYNCATPG